MQGFDPQTILPRIAAQGLERQEIRPGDWFDDDAAATIRRVWQI